MENKSKNSIFYIIGGITGALVGIAATYLIKQAGEMEGEDNPFSTKKLGKVGLSAISLLYPLIGKGKGRGKGKGLRNSG